MAVGLHHESGDALLSWCICISQTSAYLTLTGDLMPGEEVISHQPCTGVLEGAFSGACVGFNGVSFLLYQTYFTKDLVYFFCIKNEYKIKFAFPFKWVWIGPSRARLCEADCRYHHHQPACFI